MVRRVILSLGLALWGALAGAAVQDYSTTPSSNNSAPPHGAPEGMRPGSVNDVIRQVMTDIVVEAQVNRVKRLNSVSGTNTITASMSPALTAYSAGTIAVLIPAGNNTGAVTLNVNSLGALDILKRDGVALTSGDLVTGVPALLVLDSGADDWILMNPQKIDADTIDGVSIVGSQIWTSANDGAGSGLDADLLDGLNSTAFATAAHNHDTSNITSGTLPISRGGTGTTDGTTRNITGKAGTKKTLSSSTPSGGSDGELWYRY